MKHQLGPTAGIFKCHRSSNGVVHWLKLLNPPLPSHIYIWLLPPVLPRFHMSSRTLPFSFHCLCLTFLPTPCSIPQVFANYPRPLYPTRYLTTALSLLIQIHFILLLSALCLKKNPGFCN